MSSHRVNILIAEDDDAHAELIKRNILRAGITDQIFIFQDGKKLIDFLLIAPDTPHHKTPVPYVLLLDIRMPVADGVDVLNCMKTHEELRKIPVVMITSTCDLSEVEKFHRLGCSFYITKPVDPEKYADCINKLAVFLDMIQIPVVDGKNLNNLASVG